MYKKYLYKFLLVMRLTTVLLLITMMQVSASTYAQRISYSKSKVTLAEIFKEIRKQTGYNVLWSAKKVDQSARIKVNFNNTPLKTVLDETLANQDLTYEIEDKNIIIKEPSLLDQAKSALDHVIQNVLVIQSAAKDLRGRVLDQEGKALPNASIRVKGKSGVTSTDSNGEFEIKDVDEDAVILVSYVGFKTLEIALKDAVIPLEIKLNLATGELEEVKVVYNTGYQELNKERATGSVVHIGNELFNRRVGGTVMERISDLVPGLLRVGTSDRRDGNPLSNITIRGISTINANKRPLLIVDNFAYEGDPNDLNPNDVESITILKDAAASSIWGARAGNGVIVITMKKGKVNSGPSINFNSNFSFGEKPDLFSLPVVSSVDVIALEKKRFVDGYYDNKLSNTTTFPVLTQVVEILAKRKSGLITSQEAEAQIALYENHDVRDDINKYLLQTSIFQQSALNISGGINNCRYYASVGYDRNRDNDIVNRINERMTIRFDNSWKPIKNLEINIQLNWGQSKIDNKNSLGGYKSVLTNPYLRLADENGNPLPIPSTYRMTYIDTVNFPGKLNWQYQPLDEIQSNNNFSKAYTTRINSSISYTIIKGLKIEAACYLQEATLENVSIKGLKSYTTRNLINQYIQTDANRQPVYPYPVGGIYDQSNANQNSWSYRVGLVFNRTFGKHYISSILGAERNEYTSRNVLMPTQYGYSAETNLFEAVKAGTWLIRPGSNSNVIGIIPSSITGSLVRFGSKYGNVGYTYNGKYTLTGSGRIDESNFFGVEANDRKTPLWSAGLAWDIGKEHFYSINYLPYLKLRTTYGFSGNTNAGISPLATINYRSASGTSILMPYAEISSPPNPEVKWEKVRTINIGVDFGIKSKRISGSLDIYNKRCSDLISRVSVDPTSGFLEYSGNESSLQTKGVELSLSTLNLNGVVKWVSYLGFAFQKDKIIEYTVAPPKAGNLNGIFIGMPFSSIYSYRWAGLSPLNGNSQYYLGGQVVESSTANTNKRTQDDLIFSGQTSPPVFGNLRNSFSYKNATISIGMNYQFGHVFRRSSFGGSFPETNTFQHMDYLRAWKRPGDEFTTDVPGFLNAYPDSRYEIYTSSNILIEKADHIRLQDIRFDYSIAKIGTEKNLFKNASFYLYANNLGIIWKVSKYRPDTQNRLDVLVQKTIAVGCNLTF